MSDTASRLRAEWTLLLVAVQALTRLPVRVAYPADGLRLAVRYVPLVGAGVGLVAWAVFALAAAGLPRPVASVLSLAATLMLTGALHEDGLADCADGLLGGRTRDDALRIMRDSRVGAFGVLGVGVVLAAKVLAVAAMPHAGPALVAAHAAGRFFAVLPPAVLPYARTEGMASAIASPGWGSLLLAALFGLAPLLLLGAHAGAALLLAAAAALGFGLFIRRRLAGYTGDTLGAMQVLTELAVLLAACWHAA